MMLQNYDSTCDDGWILNKTYKTKENVCQVKNKSAISVSVKNEHYVLMERARGVSLQQEEAAQHSCCYQQRNGRGQGWRRIH